MKIFDERIFLKHQSVLQWNISIQWDKNRRKIVIPPLIQTFSIPEDFWNTAQKGSPTKFIGTVRQKTFDGKTWYPLVCIKFFDTPNFLKLWRYAHEIFQHCETKNFRRKNVIPPSMHKVFRYPKFSETFKGCPRIFLALWDKKFSTEKRDTPFFIHIFFETKNFLKNSRISLRKFSALWDIKFSTGNRDMPPLIHKFFSIPENFRKTEGFLYKAFRFGPVRQKVPTKPWCPPPMHENFRWKNFSEAPKCSPMKYFNTVRQKPTENRDSPPPYPNFFDTRNYCNSKGFPYKNFRHWDKKFSTENLDTPPPPLLLSKFFRDQKLVKH